MNPESRYKWFFADDRSRSELKGDPLLLLADAENIKNNAVRQVFRSGSCYIKLERRTNKSFRGEFNSARLCAAENIPVVEHLAWGFSPEGSWLITRAADGFVEAASLFKTRQEFRLYEAVANFLREIFESKIYHPDLHPGNVLTDPVSGECRLVDLHGVRKRVFFDRFRLYMMHRCIMEFRNALSDSEMFRLIGLCGIRKPERFFRRSLAREAELLKAVTPRRRRQILSGYFKYTSIEKSGRIVDIEADEDALSAAEQLRASDAAELFLFHFFLTQAKIPHRRVLALDPEHDICFLETELPEKYRSAATAAELGNRLIHNGIKSCEEDFSQGYLRDIPGVFRRNS